MRILAARSLVALAAEPALKAAPEAPAAATGLSDRIAIVDIKGWGEGPFPVEIRATFEDGTVVQENGDGKDRWTRFFFAGEAQRVAGFVPDPSRPFE